MSKGPRETWAWQGLSRDGKPVLYADSETGHHRIVRGESNMTFADARLIAAAPELLEMLERIIDGHAADIGSQSEDDLRDARALIARVKGTP